MPHPADKHARLELLAPARNAEIAIEAVKHGADAVYMGASSHGARHEAANPVSDVKRAVEFAHRFNARVYVTLNTLVYENELVEVEKLIHELYRAEVDALIIQDLGILQLDIPPIALHASTQCDIRSVEKARLMQALGFSQIVLARELSLSQISEIHRSVDIPIEAFVHGALCVSYSGCCNAGYLLAGRSGNRGECPQICRLPYTLVDGDGKEIITDRHLLSLKDMNRIDNLEEMIGAGVTSFKIEGRLKGADYVKNTVAAYRDALDRIIVSSGGRLAKSSDGFEKRDFVPDLSKSFNRGFTDYMLHGTSSSIARFESPKMIGENVGEIIADKGTFLVIRTKPDMTLTNGDGLGFFNADGRFEGFRLNRIEGNKVFPQKKLSASVKPGTPVFRNSDKVWNDMMLRDTAVRKMSVDFRLHGSPASERIYLTAADKYNHSVTVSKQGIKLSNADKPQTELRRQALGKLGNTYWELEGYTDDMGDIFVPISVLGDLKRRAIEALESCRKATRRIDYRRVADSKLASDLLSHMPGQRNIANSKAHEIMARHGNVGSETAIETVSSPERRNVALMECRYCLRRELGACLRKPESKSLKGPLHLIDRSNGRRLELSFDCDSCTMKVLKSAAR